MSFSPDGETGAVGLTRFTRWWCAMALDRCGCDVHPLPVSTIRLSFVICIWTNSCSSLCLCLHISCGCFALLLPPTRLYLKLQSVRFACPKPGSLTLKVCILIGQKQPCFRQMWVKTLKPNSIQPGNSLKATHGETWPTTESTCDKKHTCYSKNACSTCHRYRVFRVIEVQLKYRTVSFSFGIQRPLTSPAIFNLT